MQLGGVRLECERALERRPRLIEPAEQLQHVAELVQHRHVLGREFRRARIAHRRRGERVLRLKGVGEVDVKARIVRLERDRPLQAGHPLGNSAAVEEGVAEIAVRLGDGGVERDRPRDQIDRGVGLATLAVDHAEQMQAIELPGIAVQDVAIDPLRLGEAAVLMMAEGALQRSG